MPDDSATPTVGLSACITFDFDGPCSWIREHGRQDVAAISRGEFGIVGLVRVLEVLASHNVTSTFFVPGHTALAYPRLIERILQAGHEIAHHGWAHESPVELTAAEERADLERGLASLGDVTGSRPIGYRSPSWTLSESTVGFLGDLGFLYDSSCMGHDFSPYYLRAGDRWARTRPSTVGRVSGVVEMPVFWGLDDAPIFEFVAGVTQGVATPSAVLEVWRADLAYAVDNHQNGTFTLTLHPHIIARGHRLPMLDRLLTEMRALGVQFRTVADVAHEWRESNPSEKWTEENPELAAPGFRLGTAGGSTSVWFQGVAQAAAFNLECVECGQIHESAPAAYRCVRCGDELRVRYRSPVHEPLLGAGLGRYVHRLPLRDPAHLVWMGEGGTPLVPLSDRIARQAGIEMLCAKAEHLNPTGSFKDRIAALAVSLARERGLRGCMGTSSGNGGAALAAYAARAGLDAVLVTSTAIVPDKLRQILAFGARLFHVEGLGPSASGGSLEAVVESVADLAAAAGYLSFLTGFRYSPEAMEGAKTIAYELSEAMPEATVVYLPVGGGGLATATWKGYSEVHSSTGRPQPRLVCVQPEGCATLRDALSGNTTGLTGHVATTVSGLQVAKLFDARGATEAIVESGGHLTLVSDQAIWDAQRLLAESEGILVEPAGATALAGLIADARSERLRPDDRAIVLLTGAGWKDSTSLDRLASTREPTLVTIDRLESILTDDMRAGA